MNNEKQMRRKDRNVADFSLIRTIIENNHAAVISMIDEGMPYGIMMNYAPQFDGEKITLTFHGAQEGRKIDCLRKNPQVSVFINDLEHMQVIDAGKASTQWTTHYRSVIISGEIRFIEDIESKRLAAESYMCHYTQGEINIPDAALKATVFMRLHAAHVSCKQNPSRLQTKDVPQT